LEVSHVLLDTSAYSAFKRGRTEAVQAVRQAESLHLTSVVLGELKAGFRAGRHAQRNEAELRLFLASPRVHTVPVDEETAERYAVIWDGLRGAGTPIPTNDVWIAASAMQHGLIVLTADRHFQRVAQILVEYMSLDG
jgi:tRNA(fMet)-specific endonuclease VapC